MSRLLALSALLLTLLFGAAAAQAQSTSLYEIEREVMCVTCRTSLSVAGGPQAERQRDLIKQLIADGRTNAEIKDALVVEYGEAVLALPEDDGFNIAVYAVPVIVVVLALALAAIFLPRWRRRARALAGAPGAYGMGGPSAELDAADARRLDDDLKRYD